MHDDELLFDTTVLSNFARIERFHLLQKFTQKICTTKEVLEEIQKGIPKRPQLNVIIDAYKSAKINVISTTKEETILFMDSLRTGKVLGLGEISLIGIARETSAVFLTDDKMAKKKAHDYGVKILDIKERDTVIILSNLLKEKHIDKKEYDLIRQLLKENNFKF